MHPTKQNFSEKHLPLVGQVWQTTRILPRISGVIVKNVSQFPDFFWKIRIFLDFLGNLQNRLFGECAPPSTEKKDFILQSVNSDFRAGNFPKPFGLNWRPQISLKSQKKSVKMQISLLL